MRFLAFLGVTSAINALIASQMTLRVVHGMESRQFCGSCHVMTPEARAFDQGPHASILCVDCHVGEGARGLIESKLQGTRQLWSVLSESVHMPIEGAIAAGKMIPSEETCERCHWKEQPANAALRLIQRYAEDEANTPQTTLAHDERGRHAHGRDSRRAPRRRHRGALRRPRTPRARTSRSSSIATRARARRAPT
jgi:nitrate/TMAO reductase-like tetraheme cytochrome c subunit